MHLEPFGYEMSCVIWLGMLPLLDNGVGVTGGAAELATADALLSTGMKLCFRSMPAGGRLLGGLPPSWNILAIWSKGRGSTGLPAVARSKRF